MKAITNWNSDFDIVIQAGHENTPDGKTGGESAWGKEIEWTPVVANEAVRILQAAGVRAKKIDASIKSGTTGWNCKLAISVHFDDPDDGSSGPSVGYPPNAGNDAAATDWKLLYKRYFPLNKAWQADNYTSNLSGYYGYRYTRTTDAEMLMELGDLSNEEQALWLRPRLKWLGALVAHFASKRTGLGNVPDPGNFVESNNTKALAEHVIVPTARVTPPPGDTLTVRAAPKATAKAVGSLSAGAIVEIHGASGIWRKIDPTAERWVSSLFLGPVDGSPAPAPPAPPAPGGLQQILQAAENSAIATYDWPGRGVAPIGYIKGMAVTFARVYCKFKAGDAAALEMARADTGNASLDALTHYSAQFAQLGMNNAAAGADTLRHLFVLMLGLGMRESSGKHCCGRDTTATNTTAGTAEAGLFQTSWNARSASPLMTPLFQQYAANPAGFVEIFSEGVTCSPANWANFGTGTGRDYQRLAKECPAFHTEFTAVALRNIRQHWGPINTRAAKLKSEADDLFHQVQGIVDTGNLCPVLS